MSRLTEADAFSIGRSSEITRDELKFQKFIDRIRNKFSNLFYETLKRQLILKKIILPSEWADIKHDLNVVRKFAENIDYINDKNVAIAWNLIRADKDYYKKVFEPNYNQGLKDSHIETALIKACKELNIID